MSTSTSIKKNVNEKRVMPHDAAGAVKRVEEAFAELGVWMDEEAVDEALRLLGGM